MSANDPKRTFVELSKGGLINVKALIHKKCLNCSVTSLFAADDGNAGLLAVLVKPGIAEALSASHPD